MGLIFGSALIDLLAVVTAIIIIIATYIHRTYQYFKRINIPHEKPRFPWGNVSNPATRQISMGEQFRNFYFKFKREGYNHGGVYLSVTPMYMPIKMDYIKNILAKDFYNFVDRGIYVNEKKDPLGAHLFAIGGIKWKNLRAKLTPTFTSGKMKQMFQTLTDCGIILEKYMEEKIKDDQPLDIKEILGCFTTDIIGSCAFGLECNSFKEPDSPFRYYGKRIFVATKLQALRGTFSFNFPNAARFLGFRTLSKDITDFFFDVVEKAVTYREKNNIVRKDFLQLLIDLKNTDNKDNIGGDGKSLTMNEIAAQSFVFFVAGFETSSTTMNFALYELAVNQEIQNKVRNEINSVLAKYGGNVTYEAINEMKYMQQVIDETLRMYPPVPILTRVCENDYKIPGENVILEKGTKVLISVYGIHYDEEYYPNPTKFDPERFGEENKKRRHPYAHLPFGEGPRICIGLRFGLMQTKVGLTYLLKNFKFTVNEKTNQPLKMYPRSFVLSPDGGIWLNAQKI